MIFSAVFSVVNIKILERKGLQIMELMTAVTSALSEVIGWVGTVVSELITDSGKLNALLPLLAVGVAVSALMLGVKAIKSFIWGA